MVFGFFAVVGKGHVLAQAGQLNGHGHPERDALVGRAENHVELDAAGDEGLCIELRELAQLGPVIKQACVEKIRRQAAGLGLELTEAQHAGLDRELHEVLSQGVGGVHGDIPWVFVWSRST